MKSLAASKSSAKTPELCSADFMFAAPWVHAVFLVGTFNNWDAKATPMHRGDDGVWRTRLRLAAGFYHHKFVADGRWVCGPEGCGDRHCDRGCERCVPNIYGSMDLVAIVG